MATVSIPKYPLGKDELGNASWKLLHSYAAQYPDKPLKKDKEEFHYLIKSVLRTIPEGDCQCKSHAVDYVQKNPPNMNSRRDLVEWVCVFHNNTSKRAGKQTIDCNQLLENTAECESCKFTPTEKQKVVEVADKDGPLKQTLGEYKKLSVKVFEELCHREGVPVPRIVFAPCPPPNQHTSCTTFLKYSETKLMDTSQTPVVYINPSNFGLRVLIHECREYVRQMKHKGQFLPKDEQDVERHTQDIIEKYFPADSYDNEKKELVQPMIMKDEIAYEKPKLKLESISESYKNRRHAFQSRIEENFPTFAKYYNKDKESESEKEATSSGESGGLLSYFDGIYEPLAKFMNISARSLNLANTPNIFAEGSKVVINSQLSPFGSLLATTLLGVGMFVATALNKEQIGVADRHMLAQLGGQFLWGGLQTAGISTVDVQDKAIETGKYLATMDFDKITPLLIKGKSFLAQSLLTESQQRQQAGVQARQQQRGSSGAGSRGIGGGPQGGPGTSRLGGQGINQNVIERARERAEGYEPGPEDIGLFRNFPSPAGAAEQFGRGAGGVVPRTDSGGGIGFTYVPSHTPTLTDEDRRLLEEMGYPSEASTALPSYNVGMSLTDEELEDMR